MKYSRIEAVYESYEVSDHSPIILCTKVIRNFFLKPFRLLNVLLHDEKFNHMVQEVGFNLFLDILCIQFGRNCRI